MDRAGFLYHEFLRRLPYEPTSCQDALMRDIGAFLTSDEGDILVVNGYAGTGKTTVLAAVVSAFTDLKTPVILMAPTGRSAKVLSRPVFPGAEQGEEHALHRGRGVAHRHRGGGAAEYCGLRFR